MASRGYSYTGLIARSVSAGCPRSCVCLLPHRCQLSNTCSWPWGIRCSISWGLRHAASTFVSRANSFLYFVHCNVDLMMRPHVSGAVLWNVTPLWCIDVPPHPPKLEGGRVKLTQEGEEPGLPATRPRYIIEIRTRSARSWHYQERSSMYCAPSHIWKNYVF